MKMETGFTLVELLITLAVAAILLTVAVPAMRSITQNNLLVAETNRLVATFQFSRSEAVERRAQVTVCAANAGATGCSGGDTWDDNGWLSFLDLDGNGVVDAGDTILKVWESLQNSATRTVEDSASNPVFSMGWLQNGNQSGGGTVGIRITTADSTVNDRCIRIGAAGWIKSEEIPVGNCP